MEAATIWLESEAAATVDGMPTMIKQRGHEKAAPHAEQPGEKAHGPPQAKEKQDVDAVASQW